MADHCGFCDTRRPEGGTNMLIVNGGDWLEFCPPCGKSEVLTNGETGEKITVRALFDRCNEPKEEAPIPAIETLTTKVPDVEYDVSCSFPQCYGRGCGNCNMEVDPRI